MDVSLEFLRERYALSIEKIHQIAAEEYEYITVAVDKTAEDKTDENKTDENKAAEKDDIAGNVGDYFKKVAEFICMADAYYEFVQQGGLASASLEMVKDWNYQLNLDILPENYESSFANPVYAVEKLGEAYGRLLSALYAEVRSMIVPATESAPGKAAAVSEENAESQKDAMGISKGKAECLEEVLIRMELFVEVYSAFVYEWQENQTLPPYESIRQILYWYVSDYSDITYEQEIKRLHRIPGTLSGFLLGSGLVMQKSGMEKPECGLTVHGNAEVMTAGITSIFQYEHDHREDLALVWDKAMMRRKLEVIRTVIEKYQELIDYSTGMQILAEMSDHESVGKADVTIAGKHAEKTEENFCGRAEFVAADKPQALRFSPEQQKLVKEYYSQAAVILGIPT